MRLFDLDDRLIVTDDEATRGVVWRQDLGDWLAIAPAAAGKAFAEGVELERGQAVRRFPKAQLGTLPESLA